MNDQILSLVIECQKRIKELREYLKLCIATQGNPIRAARMLRYLDRAESGEDLSLEDFSMYENIKKSTLVANIKIMSWRCFCKKKNYSTKARLLLFNMYRQNEWEFFHRYVFTSKEGAKK
jgi:hypothetical protein